MIDKILKKIKECLDIYDSEPIDFSKIDRNNPPIFGPEDIFEDLYDEEWDISEITCIIVLVTIAIAALFIATKIFFECMAALRAPYFNVAV